MKICFVPIDNRPVCYNLAKDICEIDNAIELLIPPRELLGDLTRIADVDGIIKWLEKNQSCDVMVLSLDTIAYGGLIPSRRSKDTLEEIKTRLSKLKLIINGKKVYAFSSIMRISNNNCNEEEKEYWKDWGKKIFEYSASGGVEKNNIPEEIIFDYLAGRRRNFEINKMYLNWQKEGLFDTLIFSKDDCAPKGFNVDEAAELERLGGKTKTGADEIPLTLLARAIKKDINIFVEYTEPKYKNCISNYEDVSIEKSVSAQLDLGGFKPVQNYNEADVVLVVNNFIEKQGELVMGWETPPYKKMFSLPQKPYVIADVRYANGADNAFIQQVLPKIDADFYGYSGWNTSANTIGSLLAALKVKWNSESYNDYAFKKLQLIRFLDDWAYQANVRKQIDAPTDIKELMRPYEEKISKVLNLSNICPKYIYPWQRKFELEILIK